MIYARNLLVVLLLLGLVLPVSHVFAQDMELSDESRLWVEGTSNRSDWTVYANTLEGRISGVEAETSPAVLQVTVASAQIKSNESTIMDRLMHDALEVDAHPTITYELTDVVQDGGSLTATGNLTLVGVTRELTMEVEAERQDDGSIRYRGSTPLKMTDYDMEPPVAMFGALRTADDIVIHFDVTFVPAS